MDFFTSLRTAEIHLGDFLLPWGMVVGTLGFLLAWALVIGLEHLGLTRRLWNLPLFFVALATFFGCVLGLIFTP